MPSPPIERGWPGPGLLAHVLASKYRDRLPLYCKRGDEAVLPSGALNVVGEPGAGGFGLTLWIALTTTRRASGITGSRF